MDEDDILIVLITRVARDQKVRSKNFDDLGTSTLKDIVKFMERIVYAKDSNIKFEKRCNRSYIESINQSSPGMTIS